jgi:hypothetical protein
MKKVGKVCKITLSSMYLLTEVTVSVVQNISVLVFIKFSEIDYDTESRFHAAVHTLRLR